MPQHDAQARDGAAEFYSPGTGSLKARFVALRTLRPFIVMVWRISPSLTFCPCCCGWCGRCCRSPRSMSAS